MTPLERALYKTRKTPLEVAKLNDIEYNLDSQIALEQCSDCGIWLKFTELMNDLDRQLICKDCFYHYGL